MVTHVCLMYPVIAEVPNIFYQYCHLVVYVSYMHISHINFLLFTFLYLTEDLTHLTSCYCPKLIRYKTLFSLLPLSCYAMIPVYLLIDKSITVHLLVACNISRSSSSASLFSCIFLKIKIYFDCTFIKN